MVQQFDLSNLPEQFILCQDNHLIPQGWRSEKVSGWVLGRHPSLPIIRLLTKEKRLVGWILGHPVDGKGELLTEGGACYIPGPVEDFGAGLENFIYDFGGRFIFLILDELKPRIYLDPTGSMSMVYCPAQGIAASTPNLVPYNKHTEDRTELNQKMGLPYSNAIYPVGMTPRMNVHRLIPNHYLDLRDWKSERHWPNRAIEQQSSTEENVSTIISLTKRTVKAVVSKIPTYLRLTAGRDSRMLLACSRDVAHRLVLLTVPIPDETAYIDIAVAKKIAKRFGLRHFAPRYQEPKQEDLDEWMFRTGYSVGELRGWRAVTMYKQTNPNYAQLLGQLGEIADRGFWYRMMANEKDRITAESLIDLLEAPRLDVTLEPLREWLRQAPADNAIRLLDLFYIEQRQGHWSGILPYAEHRNPGFTFFPMCHRKIIEAMLSLPMQYRRRYGALMQDIIQGEWPELLEWPFSKPVGFLHVSLRARRIQKRFFSALRDPVHAVKQISARFFNLFSFAIKIVNKAGKILHKRGLAAEKIGCLFSRKKN